MKKIDFTQSGGFPLELDTFDFMQKAYHEGIDALMGHLGIQGDKNYILSGVQGNGENNYSHGWVIIGGELMRFQGGSKTNKVEVVENTKLATFKTGQAYPVYLEKFARFAQGEGPKTDDDFTIEDFIRIKKPGELDDAIAKNTQAVKTLSSKTESELNPIKNKLSTIEEGAQKNVQSDWNEINPEADKFIQNKPKILTPQEIMSDRVAFKLLSYIPESDKRITLHRNDFKYSANISDIVCDSEKTFPRHNGWHQRNILIYFEQSIPQDTYLPIVTVKNSSSTLIVTWDISSNDDLIRINVNYRIDYKKDFWLQLAGLIII